MEAIYDDFRCHDIHTVTCRPIAGECADKHVSMEMDSWKPKRRCGINRHFRGYEWSKNISFDTDTLYKRRTYLISDHFRTFIRIYSLFRSEQLSAKIILTLQKALILSIMTYTCPAWEFAADNHLLKLQLLQNEVLRTIGSFKAHTDLRYACGFQTSIHIWLYMWHVKCKLYILTTDLLLLTDWLANDRPVLLSERPTSTSLQLSDSNKHLVLSPRWVLYSKTDWPTDRWS
jgi:hypothetical protein